MWVSLKSISVSPSNMSKPVLITIEDIQEFWDNHLPKPPVTSEVEIDINDIDFEIEEKTQAVEEVKGIDASTLLTEEQQAYLRFREIHQRQFQIDLVQIKEELANSGTPLLSSKRDKSESTLQSSKRLKADTLPGLEEELAAHIPRTMHKLVQNYPNPLGDGSYSDSCATMEILLYDETFGVHAETIKHLETNLDDSFKMALLHQLQQANYYPSVPIDIN
ncbi:hypothetical protein BABINDRAFT_142005 [Babjeviella inositovora NRRL Y-12698]|uniref:Uncharacterized protein n=1 Tax=Babjeviella inositovora NRRL Y-12698 TaxID=984486 RepID=A0A1E3QNW4_9ASCO|nr:uncharacterized protein BABINDRAFT_142005 [Babjeviella inositovora NRRL Y-12698]ODQ79383.1 hypothetical protein BABINDRAFT_142005 [Babjeviella inositovora NRRL Y-12698]